jgi:transcriptional regulator of acetoin/glycerol metabolism
MRQAAHVKEIDRVLQGEATGRDAVVAASWRRCVETYGLDPTRPDPAHIVPETTLREHRQQAERLIRIARSGLQTLFRQVAGQNYVLLLADAKGVCVDFFGDPRFEDELRQAGLYLGSDWSEDLAGTCGVGSCLVTGEAVTIHQDDHFGLAHTPLSCTAAPIYDTCGQLAAVLDISLLRSPSPKSSQNLAMSLVTASARRVEMANLMAMSRREWVFRFSTSPEFLEVDPEFAVALDGSGRIVGLTRGAQDQLAGMGGESLVGQFIETLMDLTVDDLPQFMRGRPSDERVLRLKDGRGLFGHAIAPQDVRHARPVRQSELPGPLAMFAGPDPALGVILRKAARLADAQTPLLLLGETGVGKDTLARAIHASGRRPGAFHALHCAGATADRIAALADAAPGTLFLRGLEDLDARRQAALLALLEARGDLRVIASARDPRMADAAETPIRADLHFRIAGVTLALPPLRLRRDFDWLADRLLRRKSPEPLRLSPAARADLAGRRWPGNIRELETAIEVAALLSEGGVIDAPDLPPPFEPPAPTDGAEEDLEALLDACGWNMAQAARRLGVNRSTILRRIRKAGLSRPA